MIRILALIGMVIVLLAQSGCTVAMGGSKVTEETVFVEPGGVARVATDQKIKVFTTTDDGKQIVTEKNIGGFYVMPSSVYMELKENWDKTHPPVKAAPKPTGVLPNKLSPLQTVAESVDAGNVRDENKDHEEWMREKEAGSGIARSDFASPEAVRPVHPDSAVEKE